jgi:hypothetical protein
MVVAFLLLYFSLPMNVYVKYTLGSFWSVLLLFTLPLATMGMLFLSHFRATKWWHKLLVIAIPVVLALGLQHILNVRLKQDVMNNKIVVNGVINDIKYFNRGRGQHPYYFKCAYRYNEVDYTTDWYLLSKLKSNQDSLVPISISAQYPQNSLIEIAE